MSQAPLSAANDQAKVVIPSQEAIGGLKARELFFGVVGPVGSGTSEIARTLIIALQKAGYSTSLITAKAAIEKWAEENSYNLHHEKKIHRAELYQNAGDQMRSGSGDNAAVARRMVALVPAERAAKTGANYNKDAPVEPDGNKRAYIFDSLRHPAEVALLRSVYQDAFCLIGVICSEEERYDRLSQVKYTDAGKDDLNRFMRRDENGEQTFGQKVSDTFYLSDFFVNNTPKKLIKGTGKQDVDNPEWDALDQLGRLVDILTHARVIRPRASETAMYHAYGARMRSACLSRQVGAALADRHGNIISTGTNEVPHAGGGVYGGQFLTRSDEDLTPSDDHRCAFSNKYCSNTRVQNEIISHLLEITAAIHGDTEKRFLQGGSIKPEVLRTLRKSPIGQLIEFSRAVHAEMDALLSAARQGHSPVGTRLFVTTYPCHNCARHIVAAGVDEVQYIEPYLKSRALELHSDSITHNSTDWRPPSQNAFRSTETGPIPSGGNSGKVLFRPFTGIAPRLYRRAFLKDRDLKDNISGDLKADFGDPDGTVRWEVLRKSYSQVEHELSKDILK